MTNNWEPTSEIRQQDKNRHAEICQYCPKTSENSSISRKNIIRLHPPTSLIKNPPKLAGEI